MDCSFKFFTKSEAGSLCPMGWDHRMGEYSTVIWLQQPGDPRLIWVWVLGSGSMEKAGPNGGTSEGVSQLGSWRELHKGQ